MRIFLSPPDVGPEERTLLLQAFDSGWIAPLGPEVDAFEREFAHKVGAVDAAALSSGTAALHLALIQASVGQGDVVLTSTLTFAATVNAIRYVQAEPVLLDCEMESWNMCPDLLEQELEAMAKAGKLPAAVVVVHLYGQAANLRRIQELCERFDVTLIEDAAEALGATHELGAPGTIGRFGVFSFNGNKIVTTSGGGMLVTQSKADAARARKLGSQAREAAPHYQHEEMGYNYRLSNLLAAVGRAQLRKLDQFVANRRAHFDFYQSALSALHGVTGMPEAPWGRSSRWLSVFCFDPSAGAPSRETVRLRLLEAGIEARPLWKPMHQQPVFKDLRVVGGKNADWLFEHGLCLPSGSQLSPAEREEVVEHIFACKRELGLSSTQAQA